MPAREDDTPERAHAALWLGTDFWPVPQAVASCCRQHSFHPWEGLGFVTLQVGGFHCVNRRVFGLKLHVPADDELARLLESYTGSDLPGRNRAYGIDRATPLEDVVIAKRRLADMGLLLDPVAYADFGEAYIPLERQS